MYECKYYRLIIFKNLKIQVIKKIGKQKENNFKVIRMVLYC